MPYEPYEPFRRADGSTATAYDDLAALVSAADVVEPGGEHGAVESGGGEADTGEPGTDPIADSRPAEPRTVAAPVAPAPGLTPPAFVVESDDTADLPRLPVGDLSSGTAAGVRRRGAPSLLDTARADVSELRIEPIRLVVVAAVIAALYFLVRAIR